MFITVMAALIRQRRGPERRPVSQRKKKAPTPNMRNDTMNNVSLLLTS